MLLETLMRYYQIIAKTADPIQLSADRRKT